jgi:HlyD family secretion protein
MKKIIKISGIAVVVVVLSVLVLHGCRAKKQNFSIETTKVTRGKITNTVTATGTIQAIKTVAVGTQVSGVISKIYVDFNSHVKKGQLLAEIDKTQLLANVDNAKASLDDAKAEVTYQEANYNRIKALHDKNLVAQTDYDLAFYNYSKAQASLKIAMSGYEKAKINLDYATISSPIDGVVLNRAVDEGQTVAASFNTPTLFSIANDLTQMQVAANIDEADIGQVKNNQKVEFTVDAFPDLKFGGEVTEVRLQPVTTSNVVTYTVIVKAPNPDNKLMPGMTANITILTEVADDALMVPVKALQFTPDESVLQAYMKSIKDSAGATPEVQPVVNAETKKPGKGKISGAQKPIEVWVKNGPMIHLVKVETGVSDGSNTQIKSGVNEGEEVVLALSNGKEKTVAKEAATSSPFMPKRPSKK